MGRRGPKPAPSNVRELHTGKPPAKVTPKVELTGAPVKPRWMDATAKAAWDRVVPEVVASLPGMLSKIDSDQLALAMTHLSLAIAALRKMRKGGGYEVITSDVRQAGTTLRKHPASQVFRDNAQAYVAAMKELNLTPRARAAADLSALLGAFVGGDDADDDADLFDDALG